MGWPRIRKERQALQSALLLSDAVGGWQGREGVAYLDTELTSQLWT
jgi:hypothetical protein